MLGLSDGWLLGFEYPSLKRVESKQVFKIEHDAELASESIPVQSG